MQTCLGEGRCLSLTYSRAEGRCKLLPANRRSNQTRAIVETLVDFYELSCDREAVLKRAEPPVQSSTPPDSPASAETGKQQHAPVATVLRGKAAFPFQQ